MCLAAHTGVLLDIGKAQLFLYTACVTCMLLRQLLLCGVVLVLGFSVCVTGLRRQLTRASVYDSALVLCFALMCY